MPYKGSKRYRKQKSVLDVQTWYRKTFEEPAKREDLERARTREQEEYIRKLNEWLKHPKIRYIDMLTGKEVKAKKIDAIS